MIANILCGKYNPTRMGFPAHLGDALQYADIEFMPLHSHMRLVLLLVIIVLDGFSSSYLFILSFTEASGGWGPAVSLEKTEAKNDFT